MFDQQWTALATRGVSFCAAQTDTRDPDVCVYRICNAVFVCHIGFMRRFLPYFAVDFYNEDFLILRRLFCRRCAAKERCMQFLRQLTFPTWMELRSDTADYSRRCLEFRSSRDQHVYGLSVLLCREPGELNPAAWGDAFIDTNIMSYQDPHLDKDEFDILQRRMQENISTWRRQTCSSGGGGGSVRDSFPRKLAFRLDGREKCEMIPNWYTHARQQSNQFSEPTSNSSFLCCVYTVTIY